MAYAPLALSDSLPDSVNTVIRKGVEPQLQDVHWMLATAIGRPSASEPPRQLQLPIALVLLATVDGVSTQLFHPAEKMGIGKRFKECLNRYFPWDIDPCLSGCNPHPLYVGCAVIRQARVSEWKLMF